MVLFVPIAYDTLLSLYPSCAVSFCGDLSQGLHLPFEMPGMELDLVALSGSHTAQDLYPVLACLLGLLLNQRISLLRTSDIRC